ncbi:MAG: hypothetical protein M1839_002136 [Geoglossum umbratile]|nr:MAG: hypothetical protein M1839_002136 [Geoglossum umbratile]
MPTAPIPEALKADFATLDAARIAIRNFIISTGESYRVTYSNHTRYIVACRDTSYKFTAWASLLKGPKIRVTQYIPHSCSPLIHQKFPKANSVAFLRDQSHAAVSDNREIAPAQIQSTERIQFGNAGVSYQQAWCIQEALRKELEGDEAEGFKKIPALINILIEANNRNYVDIAVRNNHFQCCFIAPSAIPIGFNAW